MEALKRKLETETGCFENPYYQKQVDVILPRLNTKAIRGFPEFFAKYHVWAFLSKPESLTSCWVTFLFVLVSY